jgi:hypothetical protein
MSAPTQHAAILSTPALALDGNPAMHLLVLYGLPVCPYLQPDVLCLQEVDHWKQVRDELQEMG